MVKQKSQGMEGQGSFLILWGWGWFPHRQNSHLERPSFHYFFGNARKTSKKTRNFLSLPNPWNPGNERKNSPKNKEFLAAKKKKTRNSQKTRKGRTGLGKSDPHKLDENPRSHPGNPKAKAKPRHTEGHQREGGKEANKGDAPKAAQNRRKRVGGATSTPPFAKHPRNPPLKWLNREHQPICRSVSEDFCCINFGGFSRGDFPGGFFWALFPHKNEEKKSGEKIREKIRWPKNKNPRKIRSAKIRP